MKKITQTIIAECYELGRQVIEGKTQKSEAAAKLIKIGMNENSAKHSVDNLHRMYKGQVYKMKNNEQMTRYFLQRLYADFGLEVLKNAIRSLRDHLEYYENTKTGSAQPSHEKILNDFSQIAAGASSVLTMKFDSTQSAELEVVESRLESEGAFDPNSIEDGREKTLGSIVRRRGQSKFRNKLLRNFESRCSISGCSVVEVLEAAHIYPYLGEETNHPTNGLLLRADLHTLFDLGLIAVDASKMTVLISKKLNGTNYENFRGKSLRLPVQKACRPNKTALNLHREKSSL